MTATIRKRTRTNMETFTFPMTYQLIDDYGNELGEVFIPWEDLQEVKRSVLCTISWKQLILH